jgi:phenylpropionate dioxygenase-like ring-hydroxylating dioxygenase large terminal subunit
MTVPIVEALRRTAAEPGTGHALPAACYTDPAFFELELEHVLRPGWHAIARWDELPEPGDYRGVDVFGERVLLVRDRARQLRAFSGICLHRAFPLVEGDGNTTRFVCPYHRWVYDLEGRLQAAPLMDGVPDFDRDACRLPELPLEQWQGFVFVSTNRDTPPLAPQLDALGALLEPLQVDRAVQVAVTDWDSPWNWKVMVENFMESYHHLGPHAGQLAKTNPARGTHDVDVAGPCAVLENPAVEGEQPFWVIQVFPTFLLAQIRGALPFTSWYEMRIDRHDHLHLRIHLMLSEELAANEAVVELVNKATTDVHREDIPVCEGIQAGLQSRLWTPGRLSVQEATLRHFHRFLAERITAGTAAV